MSLTMMTPAELLDHQDTARLWTSATPAAPDVATAYQSQLALRQLRQARGEVPRGFKIGFTNRGIWPRYQVFAPIWGSVWDTTLTHCESAGALSLSGSCQPRIEPEAVFGLRATPAPDASLQDLWDAIDWVAPGFEIVQSHRADWKFTIPDTVADGGLHFRLLVGRRIPVRAVSDSAQALDALLAGATVSLQRNGEAVDQGAGSNVLDSPLRALHHFLQELRACPGAPDLQPGDVVTTGTWTDAWPVSPGQTWSASFSEPLGSLQLQFA
jgi:2-oxo-3-hexenedioate decarboxylase